MPSVLNTSWLAHKHTYIIQAIKHDKDEMNKAAAVWSQTLESCREGYSKLLEENLQLRVKITKEFAALEASKAIVIRDLGTQLNDNITKHNDAAAHLNAQVCMQDPQPIDSR